ncbi:MAG: molybdenum cofactor guanylyltransferase [Erythrobacter sp.]|uniref:molybdenum cofactor guanylyltransferase n=1 Tax=Erythrobacter sp. TaxID=1042 RepID=UPI0025CD1F1F|nr:molybdenum cofactor guanylyltransferase [Erythrobacter sp.]MCL9998465.1 molybdenum cofactor guanylyltransferase [Erythrobacter sp.]
MSKRPDIAVCILAGGSSRRFGNHKAFAELDGKPLLVHVIDRIRSQTNGPLLINANGAHCFRSFGLPIVPDGEWAGAGPLSGIHAALNWALSAGYGHMATLAVDQPFLPRSYLGTLLQAGAPAITRCGGRLHPVNALWTASQTTALCRYLETGRRDVHGWGQECRANLAEFEAEIGAIDPFFNVNTQADLAIAAQRLAEC